MFSLVSIIVVLRGLVSMKIDFHTHVKMSKKMPFDPRYLDGFFREAIYSGLDAICITEHYYNSDYIKKSFEYVLKSSERQEDCFIFKSTNSGDSNLRIFVGLEVDAEEGGHFLMIGSMECMYSILSEFDTYTQQGKHPPFQELLNISRSYSILLGVAHPFRESGERKYNIPNIPNEKLALLTFLELSGKDLANDKMRTEASLQSLSEHLSVPILAGSDTHQSFQFGCVYNEFKEAPTSILGMQKAIKNKAYSIVYGEHYSTQVKAARLIKGTLKEIHALGGDYVSILYNKKHW